MHLQHALSKQDAAAATRPYSGSTLRFSTMRGQNESTAPLWDFGDDAAPSAALGPGANAGKRSSGGSSAALKGQQGPSDSFQVRVSDMRSLQPWQPCLFL
jgi:hypothetical protein